MAMATSPHSLLLQNPTPTFLKNPKLPFIAVPMTSTRISPTTTAKPIWIKCAATTTPIQDLCLNPPESQDRVFNLAAGPANLQENVLKKAQSELYNWRGSGMSVMEMSHCGKEFSSIIQKAESDLRTLLNIPQEYFVLFLQGGATTQFTAIPLNLYKLDDKVDYLVTESWGDKAFKEAQKYSKAKIWHAFFGTPRAQNDLTVLGGSHLFDAVIAGQSPHLKYYVNETPYEFGYYLADGIYPKWATLVQFIRQPENEQEEYFFTKQEAYRKYVENAFGILQARFAIVRQPARGWDKDSLSTIMLPCIILHNMIVEDERDDYYND
ncbi:phosphoserine aminotransferase 2, chloroplastic-like [Rosa chinensis]|uniref:phosphoserine aminotransferase 2, chloroplastic-like n=1 Tax=Rosa chinensis TaxID=74649 RepID=UPI000D08AFC6|nr:phosphoserine aminotransferase 2, chloroplastic-like [Rosa chinensis]